MIRSRWRVEQRERPLQPRGVAPRVETMTRLLYSLRFAIFALLRITISSSTFGVILFLRTVPLCLTITDLWSQDFTCLVFSPWQPPSASVSVLALGRAVVAHLPQTPQKARRCFSNSAATCVSEVSRQIYTIKSGGISPHLPSFSSTAIELTFEAMHRSLVSRPFA